MQKENFYNLTRDNLAKLLNDRFGLPSYRATQLFNWVYRSNITDFSLMTDIKKEVRETFQQSFRFPLLTILKKEVSKVDESAKYLFELEDGAKIESVLIKQKDRTTLCVSSQYGCAMGCKFCRTASMGLGRNLSCAEIIGQFLTVLSDIKFLLPEIDHSETKPVDYIQNIVFMGMGEPFHNIDEVLKAVTILTDDMGLALATRRITISTCGLLSGLEKFQEHKDKINLAVSLNATTDAVRSKIMPVNNRYPITTLLTQLQKIQTRSNRQITIEYVLLSGINDSDADIINLAKLLKHMPVKINLVPYNETKKSPNDITEFKTPSPQKINHWSYELQKHGFNTIIRWSKGPDISAACGQLAV